MRGKLTGISWLLAGASSAVAAGAEGDTPLPPPVSKWEAGHFTFIPRSFEKNPHIDIMIVTELTGAGRHAPVGTAAQPVYYAGMDGGLTAVGDTPAGEQVPKAGALAEIMVKSLDASGYRAATKEHPPTIFIHYRWGSYNKLGNIDGSDEGSAPLDDPQLSNLIERAALVGGTRFAVEWMQALKAGTFSYFENKSAKQAFLVQMASDNLYFLIATAYDYAAANEGKQIILWRTKLSTDSQGITMNESLPQMVASAATYIGHETDGPVRLNRAVVKEGVVEVGTPVVVREELPSDAPNPHLPPPKPKASQPAVK
jgi:hypothetical protein